jgi:5,5'-dehydrodivanillate O-demethylase oxygenase subunit
MGELIPMTNFVAGESAVGRRAPRLVDFASAGPGTPGGEFLRKFWQPVYLSRDLAVGSAKPILIMGERFTLYRGQSGTPYIVGHRCAHRRTQMSIGWVRDDNIQCFYHGWKYDGSGACVERPAENRSGPVANITIGSRPTREHLGLIYGYFGPDAPPAFPPYPMFEEGGIIENLTEEFPCNWFQTYENFADEVHIAFVHSGGGSHSDLKRTLELPKMAAHETNYGMARITSISGGPERASLLIFPNTMRIFIPPQKAPNGKEVGGWRDSYLTLVPTDDENHILFSTRQVHVPNDQLNDYWRIREQVHAYVKASRPVRDVAKDILDGKLTLADVKDHPRFLFIEDAIAQLGQGAIADRGAERLGKSDICIAVLRRLFSRELTAISEGKPGKAWAYDGESPRRGF